MLNSCWVQLFFDAFSQETTSVVGKLPGGGWFWQNSNPAMQQGLEVEKSTVDRRVVDRWGWVSRWNLKLCFIELRRMGAAGSKEMVPVLDMFSPTVIFAYLPSVASEIMWTPSNSSGGKRSPSSLAMPWFMSSQMYHAVAVFGQAHGGPDMKELFFDE